ncbi:MAG: prolipoprotein diacylglyceryl transferase [Chromatiales bacterium]
MLLYPDIDPIAFRVGPLAVRWYGLSYVAGILAAWALMRWRAARPGSGWPAHDVGDLIFYVALGGVIGGRLGYMLFYNLHAYMQSPLSVFKVWEGGMSFHGGLIGIILAGAWWARRRGRGFLEMADFVAPAGPPALFFGRIANFINGELWGAPTSLPWGMVFPHVDAQPRHPSQLYEAALEGLVLFVVLWLYSRKPRPPGSVIGLALLGYGLIRVLIEFVREPDGHLGYLAGGWLTMGQVLSLPMILIGAVLLILAYRRAAPAPEATR